jgi:hypothetical protein
MRTTLRFSPSGGTVRCLHTELIDLRVLGRLHVVRATRITFEPDHQSWQVHCATTGTLLFSDWSRDTCLRWERDQLVPGPDGPVVTPPIPSEPQS